MHLVSVLQGTFLAFGDGSRKYYTDKMFLEETSSSTKVFKLKLFKFRWAFDTLHVVACIHLYKWTLEWITIEAFCTFLQHQKNVWAVPPGTLCILVYFQHCIYYICMVFMLYLIILWSDIIIWVFVVLRHANFPQQCCTV